MRRLEYMVVTDLVPAPENPKQHDAEAIARSMTRWGYVEPVVLDERTGRLVAGHGRIEALALLWAADLAPPDGVLITRDGWSIPVVRGWSSTDDDEAAGFLLAVNQLVLDGGWDHDALGDLLRDLDERSVSTEGMGFSDGQLEDLLGDLPPRYELTVRCATEVERHRVAAVIREMGAEAVYRI